MATTESFLANIRDLVGKDELAEAIKQLHGLLNGSPKLDEAILQSARFSEVMGQIRKGVLDYDQANITKNQIRAGILELLREVETQGQVPEIKAEFDRHLSGKVIQQTAEKIYNIDKIDNANFS